MMAPGRVPAVHEHFVRNTGLWMYSCWRKANAGVRVVGARRQETNSGTQTPDKAPRTRSPESASLRLNSVIGSGSRTGGGESEGRKTCGGGDGETSPAGRARTKSAHRATLLNAH